MNKLPISVVATAAVVLSAMACQSKVGRETEDVEEARQELREEQEELQEETQEEREEVRDERADLKEEQRELQEAAMEEIHDAEKRYLELVQEMNKYSLDTTSGVGASLEQARTDAKTKIEAAQQATNPDDLRVSMIEVDNALDTFEERLDAYEDEV